MIFNVYDTPADCYRSKIVCCSSGRTSELEIPVQEIDCEGRIYGLSYEALASIRPDYGYRNRRPEFRSLLDNGIERYEPETGHVSRVLHIGCLVEDAASRHGLLPKRFKLNHIMASPGCEKTAFLFRYFVEHRRITDLYSFDFTRNRPSLEVADVGVSHACWWDSQRLITTRQGPGGFGYYFIPIGEDAPPELICRSRDGHPSKMTDTSLLTNSYPDEFGLRTLLALDLKTRLFENLATSPEPLLFQGENRCDFHPSLSPSGRWIQFDCAAGYRRTLAVMENPLYSAE